ncbi:MAG: restriction endonuclease [Candidatus Thorarchaeota archaeon]|nr:restriction endonuclease [Candidatus Thorarchaeota archaeon]
MAVYVVRAGSYGEREDFAIENEMVVVGWDELPDLTPITSWDELRDFIAEAYPNFGVRSIGNWTGQLWRFRDLMKSGDLVVLPFKSISSVAVGEIAGDYKYDGQQPEGTRHFRKVKWLKTDLPRTDLDDDILASLGAFMTIYEIHADNAESRIRRILAGERGTQDDESLEAATQAEFIDLEIQAKDQIRKFIDRKYRGHNLARLVSAVLESKGYTIHQSSPGPDGGIDIIAGMGPMGFDSPRVVVQVKSGGVISNIGMIRELSGIIKEFGADYALFVSWGGYERSVLKEISTRFFKVRLWDSENLVSEIESNYESLPEDVQKRLPLKRIWTLVPSDIDS